MAATTNNGGGSGGGDRPGGEPRRRWGRRIAWFVFLYAASAAVVLALAYGLRALLFL
ncbi:hypothetical protein HW532_21670 [Kaustia mangrovi]|uniref:DUF2474 domain-containing protein n=1 Tax=Kaustia mangrovi TaxID=2593653 RepID=A0A7S8HE21_9HYPH|nr:hypothetical protein [Kaustia mangrovi]QPC45074.1 hypothetical protein HW532_21670 [Kaustia mangrovi]